METIEYRPLDKTEWGAGPWQSEPDKRQWLDEATGLPCLIVRGPVGALCGYVGVPKEHPKHGASYDDVDVEVHGGLTYADGCGHGDDPALSICHVPGPGEPDDVWWFGFDCAHLGDAYPGRPHRNYPDHGVYRDFAYVTDQVHQLAAQLA